jgi:hypothetical protein
MPSKQGHDVIADKPGLDVPARPNGYHEHLWPAIDEALTPGWPDGDVLAAGIKRDLDPAITIIGPTPTGGQPADAPGGICVTPENGGRSASASIRAAPGTCGRAAPGRIAARGSS